MRSKYLFAILALGAVAGTVGVSFAALLGIAGSLDLPVLIYDNQGTTTYDAGTDLLSINASPIAIMFASGPPGFVNPTGSPPSEVLTIGVLVDHAGVLAGGVSGHDLIIQGEVDTNFDQTPEYEGVLLTGEVVAFGYADSGGPTDSFDFRFAITGGALAPLYAGRDIGVEVTSEGSSFAGDFTVNFGGGAKGNVGGIEALCPLEVTKQGCVIPTAVPLGDACDGHVTRLTLRYTGEGCTASEHNQAPDKVTCTGDAALAEPVRILVTDKDGDRVYADVPSVWLEGEVVAAAANAGEDDFRAETRVRIFNADGDEIENFLFHTSCSQPLAPGNRFGSMFVAGMVSTGGGEVVFEEPTNECITEFESSAGLACDGKIVALDLRYSGGDCSQTSHSQDPDKVSCEGDAGEAESVRILVTGKNGKEVYADVENIPIGGIVGAAAANANKSKFASSSKVRIYSSAGDLLQEVEFHTSCSQPLELGDRFGSLQVFGMQTDKGTSGSLSAEVEYTYTITNNGTSPLTGVTVVDDLLGEVPGSPIYELAPGETVELTLTTVLFETTTNTVTVSSGDSCEASASSTVTFVEPPVPSPGCCDDGKPRLLTMQYTGEDCSATSHSQDADKVSCEGDPVYEPVVRIWAGDKEDPNDEKARVWFNGEVELGGQFDIDAVNGGRSKLKSNTWIHVFDLSGALLQTIKFHTSCSQPLNDGDQFGSVVLVGCIGENVVIPGNCCDDGKLRVLTMQYTGDGCNMTGHHQAEDKVSCDGDPMHESVVRIVATDKEDPSDDRAKIWFDGEVVLDDPFDIDAANAGKKKLRSKTWVHVFDLNGNLLQSVMFHTSCSQLLFGGDQFGSLLLLDCIGEDTPIPGVLCSRGAKAKILTMQYDGQDCGATSHAQDPNKVSCDGDAAGATPVRIRASDKEDPNDPNGKVWFDSQVDMAVNEGRFDIDATNAGESKLKANTWVHIFDMDNTLLQTIQFHTSCSQPLNEGDRFGSLLLIGFVPE